LFAIKSSSCSWFTYIPRYRTKLLQRSIKYQGIKVWNDIPSQISKFPKNLFVTKLKQYYLEFNNS